jgi:hypothetical protein
MVKFRFHHHLSPASIYALCIWGHCSPKISAYTLFQILKNNVGLSIFFKVLAGTISQKIVN